MSTKRASSFRHALREYFTFTPSELRGTIGLVVIIVLLIALRWTLPYFHTGKLNRLNAVTIDNPDSLIAITTPQINRLDDSLKATTNKTFSIPDIEIEHSRFAFDPNTVAFPDLLRLGFDKRIANNIVHYRSKGGNFKSGKDLLKIYGIDTALVLELQPYMVLPEAATSVNEKPNQPTTNDVKPTNDYAATSGRSSSDKAKRIIDINAADSATLVMVNGIGPTYASRIIKLRNRLGAFVSKEQLKDVFGITPEAYQIIESNVTLIPATPKKINLNTCSFDELRQHAYFDYKIAKAVIAYRDAHKGFKTVSELKNVEQIDDAFYKKIEPYVTVD